MYREKGCNALSIIIKSDKNVKVLEKKVHSISDDQTNYMLLIQEVINMKRKGISCKDIMDVLRSGKYLEMSKEYDVFRQKLEEHDRFLVKPFEVDEGVLTCNKCNSNKTYSYTKQTRSGDESTTVFAICSNCNARWTVN